MPPLSRVADPFATLPPLLRELAGTLGEGPAYRLVEHCGGTRLKVPKTGRPGHWLEGVLGRGGFQALVEMAAGVELELPKYDAILRMARHRRVRELRAQGLSLSETAVSTNYTRRHVINIEQAGEAGADDRQLRMFDDVQPS